VIMDCRFYDPNNPEAEHPASLFKRLSVDTPIIMMSAYCRAPCRRMVNADACIQKEGDGRHLLRVMELMSYARRYKGALSRAFSFSQSRDKRI